MSAPRPIYLDHHATTPCDPRVVDAMGPYWSEEFGNPASRTHAFGWRAAEALEEARSRVAAAIGADPREIVFTSGATESNNLAILGSLRAAGGGHVITCVTEHNAVLDPCRALEREGVHVSRLAVDRDGGLDPGVVEAALRDDTRLVSVMTANNEIGTLHDVAGIGRITRERGVLLHTDAAQAVGKVPVDVEAQQTDLLSLTAHKVYGPKGIGALFVRRGVGGRLEPLVHGGGHERGLRSGTVPVALCVGLARCLELACSERESEAARLRELRDRLWQRLREALDGVRWNGNPERCLPGNLNVSFDGVEGEALVLALEDVAVSTGSACTSAKQEPSHVLRALGHASSEAAGSLRFGLGRGTTADEVERAADLVTVQVRRLRELAPPKKKSGRRAIQ